LLKTQFQSTKSKILLQELTIRVIFNRARRIFVTTAIVALAAGCFAPNPPRQPQDLGGEHVSFTTSDGVLLRGHLYGSGSTCGCS
jgi:hypothetical protein